MRGRLQGAVMGLSQVNVQLPSVAGSVKLELAAGGEASDVVTVYTR